MIESYQHLRSLPDTDYAERKIAVSLQPGREYKSLVRRETIIKELIEFPHRINDLLEEHYGITDDQKERNVVNRFWLFNQMMIYLDKCVRF